jgi:hypothetical protein
MAFKTNRLKGKSEFILILNLWRQALRSSATHLLRQSIQAGLYTDIIALGQLPILRINKCNELNDIKSSCARESAWLRSEFSIGITGRDINSKSSEMLPLGHFNVSSGFVVCSSSYYKNT